MAAPSRTRKADPVEVAALAVVVAGFLAMAWQWRWTHDDGFITFRVVDQVFAGNGPVFNAGQRVEATTSPLHLWVLVGLRALFGWFVDQAWLSALLTMGAAAGGLVGAAVGAGRLARAGGAKGRLVPFAVLVPAALPPMWEYATAGLETGLVIGWVGWSFAVLAGLAAGRPASPRRLVVVAVLVGLGPLLRPEATLFSIGFVALLATFEGSAAVRWWRLVLAAVALPLAYEVFRMGYYANLLPNTALAKQAGSSRWGQGVDYLTNFSGPYLLVLPLLLGVAWLVGVRRQRLVRVFGGADGRNLVLVLVGAAALQALYVVCIGGDYMHARMLLVPLFALCCPLAVVPLPRAKARWLPAVAAVGAMACWAAFTAVALRAPAPSSFFGPNAIAEQRPYFVGLAQNPHPVTLDDWSASPTYEIGDGARRAAEERRDVLLTSVSDPGVTLDAEVALSPGRGVYLFVDGIGVAGSAAGTDVHVIDYHGLADPIASRLEPVEPRGLPGHEKELPQAWAVAEAAGAGWCDDVDRLLRATDGPMTFGTFFANLGRAPGLTLLEVSADPASPCQPL